MAEWRGVRRSKSSESGLAPEKKTGSALVRCRASSVHGNGFVNSGGIRNLFSNMQNSAKFRGIPWHFEGEISRNSAKLRAFSHTEFRMYCTVWSYPVSPNSKNTIKKLLKNCTSGQEKPGLSWTCLHRRGLSCTWTCLHRRNLSCTWRCLYHRGLSCTWTCLHNRSLCCSWTCLYTTQSCAAPWRVNKTRAWAEPYSPIPP